MSGQYTPRPIRPTGVLAANGWRLKRYEITIDGYTIGDATVSAVTAELLRSLPAAPPDELGIGFLIIREGTEAVWTLADLWHGDVVHQHTFRASLEDPEVLTVIPPGGPTACTWELEVHAHERGVYIEHVLDPIDGPQVEAYLADVMQVANGLPNGSLVREFNTAWAAGDIDGLMAVMSEDPVYRASTGPDSGTEYRGRYAVEGGFRAIVSNETMAGEAVANEAMAGETLPQSGDVHIFGHRGISFWSYQTAHPAGGQPVIAEGVDVWTFSEGKITVKDAYRKAFLD